jgi:hypothetical protein
VIVSYSQTNPAPLEIGQKTTIQAVIISAKIAAGRAGPASGASSFMMPFKIQIPYSQQGKAANQQAGPVHL